MLAFSEEFVSNLDSGQDWEKYLFSWLRTKGCYTITTHQYGLLDEAPYIHCPDGTKLPQPDGMISYKSELSFIEVKHKTEYLVRDYPILKTGLDLISFRNMQRIKDITGIPVWLYFIHTGGEEENRFILAQEIDELPAPERSFTDSTSDSQLAVWPISVFKNKGSSDKLLEFAFEQLAEQ